MNNDQIITDEINELAVLLSELDQSDNSARIRTAKTNLAEKLLTYVDLQEYGGKARSKMLGKHNGKLPYEDVYDKVTMLMTELINKFNSSRGAPFVQTYVRLLNMRLVDIYEDLKKRGELVISEKSDKKNVTYVKTSLEGRIETLGEAGDVSDPVDFTDSVGELSSEVKVFVRLAPIILEQKRKDEHLTKKMWFERFFTFDVTKTVKKDADCAKDAVSANETLFPLMETILLEYLIDGIFNHMRDVAENKLKDAALLNKRNEAIQKCYNISQPTVCDRNAKYYEIFRQAVYA